MVWSDWLSIIAIGISLISFIISVWQNRKLHNDSKNFELIEIRKKIYYQLKNSGKIDVEDIELYFSSKDLLQIANQYKKILDEIRSTRHDSYSLKNYIVKEFDDGYLLDELEKSLNTTDTETEEKFKEYCEQHKCYFDPYFLRKPPQKEWYNYYELFTKEKNLISKLQEVKKILIKKNVELYLQIDKKYLME